MNDYHPRPTAFVLVSTHHGTMLVNRHDYHQVSGYQAYGVGHQLLSNSSFDPQEVKMALQLLELRKTYFGPGVVAIDCGANIGVHTIEWARLMQTWGEVLAIEAQERVFYALAGNLALNNCFNARAIWAAVGAQEGEIGVPIPNYFQPSSFGSMEIRKKDSTEFIGQAIDYSKLQATRMMAMDHLNLARLDFIKIDIEGMEMEALQGASNTIRRHHPVMLIESLKSDKAALEAFLREAGYQIFPMGINMLAIHNADQTLKHIQTNKPEQAAP